jgi:hypothetical protein
VNEWNEMQRAEWALIEANRRKSEGRADAAEVERYRFAAFTKRNAYWARASLAAADFYVTRAVGR